MSRRNVDSDRSDRSALAGRRKSERDRGGLLHVRQESPGSDCVRRSADDEGCLTPTARQRTFLMRRTTCAVSPRLCEKLDAKWFNIMSSSKIRVRRTAFGG